MTKMMWLTACGVLSVGMCVQAQSVPADSKASPGAGEPMAFDVVSIRENKSAQTFTMPVFGPTADGYKASNMPLVLPLLTAYVPSTGNVTFFGQDQVVGLPDWAARERYDMDAKVAEADQAEWQKPAMQPLMLRAMLQSALADRLKLVVHRETKETSVMFLEVSKGGPKFKESDPAVEHPAGIKLPFGGELVPSMSGSMLYGTSMASLATLLSSMSGQAKVVIVDRTGLTGKYDVMLKLPERIAPSPEAAAAAAAADPGGMIVPVEPLGLKLASGKTVMERLVIDHIERPTAN